MSGRLKSLTQILEEAYELNLPPFHYRRFGNVLDALVSYLHDSDSNPEVVGRMFEVLRNIPTQEAGEQQARSVLRAIDTLVQEGYMLSIAQDTIPVCVRWLKAWELVKEMAAPKMRTIEDFDRAYPDLTQSIYNWSYDLEMELHNAGIDDPIYHEHRLRYVREFMDILPGM